MLTTFIDMLNLMNHLISEVTPLLNRFWWYVQSTVDRIVYHVQCISLEFHGVEVDVKISKKIDTTVLVTGSLYQTTKSSQNTLVLTN